MVSPVVTQSLGQTSTRKRRRQNPVSCRFCREKKLKCDRQSPCSSCFSRGFSCSNESESRTGNEAALPESSSNAMILDRLRYLETIVLNQASQNLPGESSRTEANVQEPFQTSAQGLGAPVASNVAVARTEGEDPIHNETPLTEYPETVQSLEGTGLQREPWLRTNAVHTSFRVATVQEIIFVESDPAVRDSVHRRSIRSCTLPSKEEAVLLLDYYEDHLEPLQHILYIPRVRENMDTCYNGILQGQAVSTSSLFLLLSIFASAAGLMAQHLLDTSAPFSPSESTRISAYWAELALEIMKEHHRRPCEMLEDIQATIILTSLLLNFEGFSARMYSFGSVLVSRARDLSLHKIDAQRSFAPRDVVDVEIGRRVWWYIVTVDWLLAMSGGPHEGTYLVQPRQTVVNYPRNIDDKDLIYTNPPINRSLSEPTAMAYDIHRLKLAAICRAVVDLIPLSSNVTTKIDYQQVIALDQKFDDFLQELPFFLRNDEQSIQQSQRIVARYPQMRIQRQLLSMTARSKRCKMHQPFLIRGSVDTRYSYSRTISLKSARMVLDQRRRNNPFDSSSGPADRYKLGVNMIYHTFMATIVLVMDLCFNKKSTSEDGNSSNSIDGDEDDETRVTKAEVLEACHSLHQDQSASGRGTDYLASLMDVLRNYKVKLRPTDSVNIGQESTPRTDGPPALRAPIKFYPSVCSTQDASQEISFPCRNVSAHEQYAITSSNNFDDARMDMSSLDVNYEAHGIEASNIGHGIAVATNSSGFFADFDDTWNDYVNLGSDLDVPLWDNLFSDLQLNLT